MSTFEVRVRLDESFRGVEARSQVEAITYVEDRILEMFRFGRRSSLFDRISFTAVAEVSRYDVPTDEEDDP